MLVCPPDRARFARVVRRAYDGARAATSVPWPGLRAASRTVPNLELLRNARAEEQEGHRGGRGDTPSRGVPSRHWRRCSSKVREKIMQTMETQGQPEDRGPRAGTTFRVFVWAFRLTLRLTSAPCTQSSPVAPAGSPEP